MSAVRIKRATREGTTLARRKGEPQRQRQYELGVRTEAETVAQSKDRGMLGSQ